MNYWIFTVAPHKDESESYSPEEIYNRRMQDRFWGLPKNATNKDKIREGDQVVFYLANERKFAGTARLASDCFELSSEEQSSLSHKSRFFTMQYGVRLTDITGFQDLRPIIDLVDKLQFITNKESWGAHLQGAIREIPASDFAVIAKGGIVTARVATDVR